MVESAVDSTRHCARIVLDEVISQVVARMAAGHRSEVDVRVGEFQVEPQSFVDLVEKRRCPDSGGNQAREVLSRRGGCVASFRLGQ